MSLQITQGVRSKNLHQFWTNYWNIRKIGYNM